MLTACLQVWHLNYAHKCVVAPHFGLCTNRVGATRHYKSVRVSTTCTDARINTDAATYLHLRLTRQSQPNAGKSHEWYREILK